MMRSFIIILTGYFLITQTCSVARPDHSLTETGTNLLPADGKISFEKQVLPIMVKNCSPCHFTGGKMYELLPFDKDTTIIRHGEKILGRIKNGEENSILKAFLLQNKNGSPQ
ncbi:MAG: hypothetical protein JNK14_03575 [Chitinophagaceae bacterium]|nr:hypothetical protein [Chitinophagaceae bacterium]